MPGTLKLNSGGAGNLILTPSGSVGSDVTVTLPASTATLLTNKTAGAVLQVVQTVKTSSWSSTSSSYVDVTGMSVSITPTSASNKILVMVSLCIAGQGEHVAAKLVRDSTDLGLGDASGSATRATMYGFRMYSVGENAAGATNGYTYLDSPATTSSVTYKIQAISPTGAQMTVNQSSNGSNGSTNAYRTSSTITVMEIAG